MANTFPGTGTVQLENGIATSLCIQTAVTDNATRDAITLYENSGQASGRQSISWYNGGNDYYKARLWTEVGGGYNATTFGIDVADDARNVATRMVIRNGNVGIGTTLPSERLHIYGGGSGPEFRLEGTWGSHYIRAYCNNFNILTAGTLAISIKNNGNFGIGNSCAQSPLDVYGAGLGTTNSGTVLNLRGGNNSDLFGTNQILFNYGGGAGENSYAHAIKSRHNSGAAATNSLDFFIWTPTDTSSTAGTKNVMSLAGSGNVGIGTCSPANALHIYRASGFATMALQVGGNYGYFLANGCCMGIASDSGTTGIKFHISRQAPDDAMLITQAGNVGINCSAPSYKLHVNGTFYAAGSSCEYKTSICNYNTDSCMFMKLKPVTYQYKEEYCHLGKELKSGTQIGLIAEEVAESHPELAILVNEEDEKVVRNVDYEKLTIILLSELQKLRQEVDQLKNK